MYVAEKPQRPTAKPAKPVLKPDVIQTAMDKRPRLNANTRTAPKPGASGMAQTPGINPGVSGRPAWQQLRDQGIAGAGSAAGNRAALAGMKPDMRTDILTAMPPGGGVMGAELPPPKEPFGGGKPPVDYGTVGNGGPFTAGPMATGGVDPNGGPFSMPMDGGMQMEFVPPSGSQNPQFSANLPPEIMQRLQALQAGRSGVAGGRGVPGAQPPGTPAAMSPPTLPDYYSPPQARGQRPMQAPTFDRRMAY